MTTVLHIPSVAILLAIVSLLLVWLSFKSHGRLLAKVKHFTYLNYLSDLTELVAEIKSADNIADIKALNKELDELYDAASGHCHVEFLEKEFKGAYLLVLARIVDLYEEEIILYEKRNERAKDPDSMVGS